MKKIVIVLLVISVVCSCKKSTPVDKMTVSVDSLVTKWKDSWNRHDSAAIRNLFDRNPILVADDIVAKDLKAISENWIHPNIRAVYNLKIVQLQGWANEEKAGYLGTYSLDLIVNKAVVEQPKGVVSISWKKTEEGVWKITNAHLHSFHGK